jgi:hypothetical protein
MTNENDTTILQKIKNVFKHKPTPEEIEQEEKLVKLENLYQDIKRLRAEGDYYGKYPGCRYAYDSVTGKWINQGPDGVQG